MSMAVQTVLEWVLSVKRYAVLVAMWYALITGPVMAGDLHCDADSSGRVTTDNCLRQLLNQADVELNERYRGILSALAAAGAQDLRFASARQQLIESQRSWIKFRDLDCMALATLVPQDPAIDRRSTFCLVDRTQRRLRELEAWERLLPDARTAAPAVPDVNVGGNIEYAKAGAAIAGRPVSYWIERYWQWQLSFPPGRKPSDDPTGSMCGIRQNGPVFFLTGSDSMTPVTRRCIVPRGRFIIVPVINTVAMAETPDNAVDCQSFQRALRQVTDSGTDLMFAVNGVEAPRDAIQKAGTECFMLNDAVDSKPRRAAGAGYWIVLKPPAPGRYVVKFSGRFAIDGFNQSIVYELTVQ